MEKENYFFDFDAEASSDKIFALVIFDITDNKKRYRITKVLSGYGNRVQKSAFEVKISKRKYLDMLDELQPFGSDGDSVRMYKIIGKGTVTVFGQPDPAAQEDVVVI